MSGVYQLSRDGDRDLFSFGFVGQYLLSQTRRVNPRHSRLTCQSQRFFSIWKTICHGSALCSKTQNDGHHTQSIHTDRSISRGYHRQSLFTSLLFRPLFYHLGISERRKRSTQYSMIYLSDRLQSDFHPSYVGDSRSCRIWLFYRRSPRQDQTRKNQADPSHRRTFDARFVNLCACDLIKIFLNQNCFAGYILFSHTLLCTL